MMTVIDNSDKHPIADYHQDIQLSSVRYIDEIPLLEEKGVDAVYSLYEEAGVGFADHVCEHNHHHN